MHAHAHRRAKAASAVTIMCWWFFSVFFSFSLAKCKVVEIVKQILTLEHVAALKTGTFAAQKVGAT